VKKKINDWFGTHRLLFNKCVEESRREENKNKKANFINLRNVLITKKHKEGKELKDFSEKEFTIEDKNFKFSEEIYNIPKDLRAGSIKEFVSRWNITKRQNDTMRFKEKKDITQTLNLPGKCLKINFLKGLVEIKLFSKICKELNFMICKDKKFTKIHDDWCKSGKPDFKFSFDRNDFWLILPIKKEFKKYQKTRKVVGIDPGVKSIVTCYNQDECYSYVTNKTKLDKYLNELDEIQKRSGTNSTKRYLLKSRKLQQRIDSYHTKIAKELVKRNDIVVMGRLDSQKLTRNEGEWKKEMNRDFLNLRSYKLRQRIELECVKASKKFVLVNESYTSKTCTSCGTIDRNLGTKRTFKCINPLCGKKFDRDGNASRNILLKFLNWSVK
jgi:IS605 OrfB family transposase